MTVIDLLPAWLQGWMAVPFDALHTPLSAIVLFAFGAVHVLLPGHGKILLAARHLASKTPMDNGPVSTRAESLAVPVLDAFAFAGARALVAFALVICAIYAATAFGVAVPLSALRVLAGCALIAIGLHLLLHTVTRNKQTVALPGAGVSDEADIAVHPLPLRQLNRSLVLLAITPEPVALAIASFGIAQFDVPASALGILCLALGMGTTLSITTLFAGQRSRFTAHFFSWSGLAIGLILAATGAIVIADAL